MRTRLSILLSIFLAAAAFGQTAEYARSSAADLDMTTKHPSAFDGSFSLSTSRSLGATFGGTLVKDRVWFFASGERDDSLVRTAVPMTRTDLNASFGKVSSQLTAAPQFSVALPKDFLSLHSTTVLSPSSFLSIDVRSRR